MYDYVLQLGFDRNTEEKIQNLKDYLKNNNIKDKERKWLPHITIDLYDCKNINEFIIKLGKAIEDINAININFKNLNDFDNKTLYIEPCEKNDLLEIKDIIDRRLEDYRIERRKSRIYKPHVTLCTNEDIRNAYKLALERFKPFSGQIKYLWIYNCEMELIKEYELK